MVHDAAEGSAPRVPSPMRAWRSLGAHGVQTVVQVEGLQTVQADDPVKLRQNTVQIPGHIVPGIGDVAGIQTDPHLLRQRYPVQNFPQLLERLPTSFPCRTWSPAGRWCASPG